MKTIPYIDRATGEKREEKVFGAAALNFVYGDTFAAPLIRWASGELPLVSSLYGWWQKQPWTKKKIAPFIEEFEVDSSEFLKRPEEFTSFNDFFVRKLHPDARPIDPGPRVAVIPADGRYHFFRSYNAESSLFVKGNSFTLSALLGDKELAARYAGGALIFGRLCPSDYHRFHFPFDCIPGPARLINGTLFSVNPLALRKNISILAENRRYLTELESPLFGKVLFIEVGATNVGTVTQTYEPGSFQRKGEEKGFFSFGGSAILLLFPPGALTLAEDLREERPLELRCLLGQPLGTAS